MRSTDWDTRTAAGNVIQAIAINVPTWEPPENPIKKEPTDDVPLNFDRVKLTFLDFDIEYILQNGKLMLESGDGQNIYSIVSKTDRESLDRQKSEILKQFGDDLVVDDEDIMTYDMIQEKFDKSADVQSLLNQKGLSSRQKNMAKRKLRELEKSSNDIRESSDSLRHSTSELTKSGQIRKTKTVVTNQPKTDSKIVIESVMDVEKAFEDQYEWPFEKFCDDLLIELFDSSWERRHGAAIGLREILKVHGSSAGKRADTTSDIQKQQQVGWHVDCAIRILCVLVLDRFSDFSDDSAISPVRENAAQVLAIVYRFLEEDQLLKIINILKTLLKQEKWEVRHSGLLGLKYMFAVKGEFCIKYIDSLFPSIIDMLGDFEDEVRMAAADSLLAAIKTNISIPPNILKSMFDALWPALEELDEISSSTTSIMSLLAEFYSRNFIDAVTKEQENHPLSSLIPKLWPFFRHNIKTVREACLNTLLKMLESNTADIDKWLPYIIDETVILLFQNFVLEEKHAIIDITYKNWNLILNYASTRNYHSFFKRMLENWMDHWISIVSTRRGTVMNRQMFHVTQKSCSGGAMDRTESSVEMQFEACKAISAFFLKVPLDLVSLYPNIFQRRISSSFGNERQIANLLIYFMVKDLDQATVQKVLPHSIIETLMKESAPYLMFYGEVSQNILDMRKECEVLMNSFVGVGVDYKPSKDLSLLTIDDAQTLISTTFNELIVKVSDKSTAKGQPTLKEKLEARRKIIENTILHLEKIQEEYQLSTSATTAASLLATKHLPEKVSGIINPIMKSIKRESNPQLQELSCESLSLLIFQLYEKSPKTNAMVLKNVTNLLTLDMSLIQDSIQEEIEIEIQPNPKKRLNESSDSISKKRKVTEENSVPVETSNVLSDENIISCRGAEKFLNKLTLIFGDKIFEALPYLWNTIFNPLNDGTCSDHDLIVSLRVIASISSGLDDNLKDKIESLMELIIAKIKSKEPKIRSLSAKTLAVVTKKTLPKSMNTILRKLIPLLEDSKDINARRGAALSMYSIVDGLGFDILPYTIFFIVPILGRMSDQDMVVRKRVTFAFATLVKLMPLESSIPDPEGMDDEFRAQRERERHFLDQLLGGKKPDQYDLPIKINTNLRQYQQEGVNWLAFLNKYNLHGILADDMGLGKTLQTICIISSDYYHRKVLLNEKKTTNIEILPSMIVCPPTLIGHWANEVNKFCGAEVSTLQYKGNPSERSSIRHKIQHATFVIMSYDVLRNDIDYLSQLTFNYCALDEGHIIRNAASKVTLAAKRVCSNHRLILTGTPIQNNVLELWSLFDFLMPGFLGTERQFKDVYSKPILSSRDAKASSKEQEKGVMAMEALHRQVLPFILRRMKEDVLHDLPPKIIQDVHVELSDLQVRLYEDFSHSGNTMTENSGHIFQSLQYLKKLCSHPKLVLNEKHPKYHEVLQELRDKKKALDDITLAPKLVSLKQLLLECGIGVKSGIESVSTEDVLNEVATQHRVLIFAQLKQTLDIIENDLFKKEMPTVTYMRLDGSVSQENRFGLVDKFNSDPTIDVLLLTVSVGGLGLNLTGANTVIFMEHDWNPQNDIQAMDRAHRIGQTKTVNVYRLITKGTLEEKIMSLQKFKLNIANTVVNKENQSFESMDTSQLFDLFKYSDEDRRSSENNDEVDELGNVIKKGHESGLKEMMKKLDNLWDENQYAEEYNLDSFLENLK